LWLVFSLLRLHRFSSIMDVSISVIFVAGDLVLINCPLII
jgi:hypothetical protein